MRRASALVAMLAACCVIAGCQTSGSTRPDYDPPLVGDVMPDANVSNSIILREGDVVKVAFPSAPNLDATQPIRRDGKITMQMVGEITAAGLTPTQLEAEVLKVYAPQLLTKEVSVSVVASSFPVFVMGAVLKPGKMLSDRPLTALEAIMEAGGFSPNANQKNVLIIRRDNGVTRNFRINLKNALQGKPGDPPFDIKPSDIIIVSERFTWF